MKYIHLSMLILSFSMTIAHAETLDNTTFTKVAETATNVITPEDDAQIVRNENAEVPFLANMPSLTISQLRLQFTQVSMLIQEILQLVNEFELNNERPMTYNEFNALTTILVGKSGVSDFIELIKYEPHLRITVFFSSNPNLIKQIQGYQLQFDYVSNGWQITAESQQALVSAVNVALTKHDNGKSSAPTIAGSDPSTTTTIDSPEPETSGGTADISSSAALVSVAPNPYDFYFGMALITSHCNTPLDYRYPSEGMMSDKEWCPAWHQSVMPAN